jgi:thymidylate synthase (FAD)
MDGWNEVSRRYVEDTPEFYTPDRWRAAPENKKQGSGGNLNQKELSWLNALLELSQVEGEQRYNLALENGVCAEQARLFLPAYAMYTTWRWSASLQSVMHFIDQRSSDDAQAEIRDYSNAVKTLTELIFPGIIKCYEE